MRPAQPRPLPPPAPDPSVRARLRRSKRCVTRVGSPPAPVETASDARQMTFCTRQVASRARQMPSCVRRSPSDARQIPSCARRSPSDACQTPSCAGRSPSDTRQMPSCARGSPSDARQTPFCTAQASACRPWPAPRPRQRPVLCSLDVTSTTQQAARPESRPVNRVAPVRRNHTAGLTSGQENAGQIKKARTKQRHSTLFP